MPCTEHRADTLVYQLGISYLEIVGRQKFDKRFENTGIRHVASKRTNTIPDDTGMAASASAVPIKLAGKQTGYDIIVNISP